PPPASPSLTASSSAQSQSFSPVLSSRSSSLSGATQPPSSDAATVLALQKRFESEYNKRMEVEKQIDAITKQMSVERKQMEEWKQQVQEAQTAAQTQSSLIQQQKIEME